MSWLSRFFSIVFPSATSLGLAHKSIYMSPDHAHLLGTFLALRTVPTTSDRFEHSSPSANLTNIDINRITPIPIPTVLYNFIETRDFKYNLSQGKLLVELFLIDRNMILTLISSDCVSLSSVTLTNVARADMPRQGADRGPDVYPFFDHALAGHYRHLVLPDRAQSRATSTLQQFDPAETALRHCWVQCTATDYNAAPHQQKAWPFRRTVSEFRTKIRLRGQSQRRALLFDICDVRGKKKRYKLPRESIHVDSTGRWYLHVCYLLTDQEKFDADEKARKDRQGRTVLDGQIKLKSLDPGARTPYTVYTSEGQTIDIGAEEDRARLRRLRHRQDELQSQLTCKRPKNRRPSHKLGRRKRQRRFAEPRSRRRNLEKDLKYSFATSANLVRELHCRADNFLAVSSDVIIMPRMEVMGMVKRRRSRLTLETKRELLGWSHAAFVNRLAVKCHDIAYDKRYPHKTDRPTTLLVQPEAYTSKTCACCGQLNSRLGESPVHLRS